MYALTDKGGLEMTAGWTATPGAGPRHLALHPNGTSLFSINELNGTLSHLHVDVRGNIEGKQTLSTLPKDFTDKNSTAEVVVHPSGRFVYSSNRGHDSVAAFSFGPDQTLSLMETEPTQGGHPRHIALSPNGNWLIAANRDTDNLVSFAVDPNTGTLTPSTHQAAATRPICVIFRPMK